MKEHRLDESLSLEDVGIWASTKSSPLHLVVGSNARCDLLVEQVARAKLREIHLRRQPVRVRCTGAALHSPSGEETVRYELFSSLLGLELMYSAESIIDSSGDDVRKRLLAHTWLTRTKGHGVLTGGRRRAIVARDPDSPIPPCFRDGARMAFPRRDTVADTVVQSGREMTGDTAFGASGTEQHVATFIYEALLNCHEHGRTTVDGVAVPGIRGTSIEKLRFPSKAEIAARRHLPNFVRDYLANVWDYMKVAQQALAITVSDNGPGIHTSLPSRTGETKRDRLSRAFSPMQSRKPRGGNIPRGLGLDNVIASSIRLAALIIVRSGGILATLDCSQAPPSNSPPPWKFLSEDLGVHLGTDISIIWPQQDGSPDQGWLFDRRGETSPTDS